MMLVSVEQELHNTQQPMTTQRSVSVLLIEEDIAAYEQIRRELYMSGAYPFDFMLTHSRSMSDGLTCLLKQSPDIVLLSLAQPEESGRALLRGVRAKAADIPIIILADSDDENIALQLIEEGAHEYLEKGKYAGLLPRVIAHSMLRADLLRKLQETERATRTNSLKRSAFFDNMSHEIRTPLTAIIGFSETLLRSKLNAAQTRSALQSIFSNGRHLLQVINDILDLSKIDAGELKIERVRDKLQPLLRDLYRTFASRAKEKGLSFSIEFEPPVPAEIETDFFRLKQILLNLIGNAIKFTSEGFVKVTLRTDADDDLLTLEVKDSGVGIPEEAKSQLFRNFSQGQKNVAQTYGGSGLGLVICDQLIKRLGGKIEFYSRHKIGSVFSVSLPLGSVGRETLTNEIPNLEELVDGGKLQNAVSKLTGRALVVDDFEDNRNLLSLLLGGAGMEVDTAEDGQVALTKTASMMYDIVLLDMQMPRMDGRQVARTLRSQGKTMPIVAVTASVLDESVNECLTAGCDACLRKPFRHEELLDCVAQFLSQGAKGKNSEGAEPSLRDDQLSVVRQSFRKKLPRLLSEIEGAYESKDLNRLKAEAHRMVGAGLFGYLELSHLGGVLETLIIQEQTGGLGLIEALVKRIKSEVGNIALQAKAAPEQGNLPGNRATIIVAEDDEINLKVVCRTLSTKGFVVAPARSEEDALRLCDDGVFALLVVSLDMNGGRGTEIIEKVRAKLQAQTPVILMTSRSIPELGPSFETENVTHILTKPIQRDKLFEAIDSVVISSLAGADQ